MCKVGKFGRLAKLVCLANLGRGRDQGRGLGRHCGLDLRRHRGRCPDRSRGLCRAGDRGRGRGGVVVVEGRTLRRIPSLPI